MMKTKITSLIAATLFISAPISAQQLTVEVTNLTHGIYFTPLLISAHNADTHLFQLGESASSNLQAMAEGGNISGLAADVRTAGGGSAENPAGGLLAPGKKTSISATFDIIPSLSRLSIVAMMLPTNDGFIGLDSKEIPTQPGTYTFFLNGYDAGTEANDEIVNGGGAPGVAGIPEDPGSNAGTGGTGVEVSSGGNQLVHIHRNIIGDTDATGGSSDLDSRVHRWLNPVARVVLTIK